MSYPNTTSGCDEYYSELCALAMSGSLPVQERQALEVHLADCKECRRALAEYQRLASHGMARIAASIGKMEEQPTENLSGQSRIKQHFLEAVEVRGGTRQNLTSAQRNIPKASSFRQLLDGAGVLWSPPMLRAAAAVIFAVILTYVVVVRRRPEVVKTPAANSMVLDSLRTQMKQLQSEKSQLQDQLTTADSKAGDLEQQVRSAAQNLAQVRAEYAKLGTRLEEESASLASVTNERDSLNSRLQAAESTLKQVREELTNANDDKQRVLLRATSLDEQVNRLNAQLTIKDQSAERATEYLASDRDIRELMGARNLYIADVFDVDYQGRTKKPFGRVFYTKGKSLIFYAFDLDKQPGYQAAKAFQAWGRPAPTQSSPISLGIFYVDSEANRRWVLKSDDPRVLDEISSVFVTVEPPGGSRKPTNKPFLVAYLHTAPTNHP